MSSSFDAERLLASVRAAEAEARERVEALRAQLAATRARAQQAPPEEELLLADDDIELAEETPRVAPKRAPTQPPVPPPAPPPAPNRMRKGPATYSTLFDFSDTRR